MSADWTSALTRARAHAPFLERGLERLPALESLLAAGRGEQALAWAKKGGEAPPGTGWARPGFTHREARNEQVSRCFIQRCFAGSLDWF